MLTLHIQAGWAGGLKHVRRKPLGRSPIRGPISLRLGRAMTLYIDQSFGVPIITNPLSRCNGPSRLRLAGGNREWPASAL